MYLAILLFTACPDFVTVGDLDGSCKVDFPDFVILSNNYGQEYEPPIELPEPGIVVSGNGSYVFQFEPHFRSSRREEVQDISLVPEPCQDTITRWTVDHNSAWHIAVGEPWTVTITVTPESEYREQIIDGYRDVIRLSATRLIEGCGIQEEQPAVVSLNVINEWRSVGVTAVYDLPEGVTFQELETLPTELRGQNVLGIGDEFLRIEALPTFPRQTASEMPISDIMWVPVESATVVPEPRALALVLLALCLFLVRIFSRNP